MSPTPELSQSTLDALEKAGTPLPDWARHKPQPTPKPVKGRTR